MNQILSVHKDFEASTMFLNRTLLQIILVLEVLEILEFYVYL